MLTKPIAFVLISFLAAGLLACGKEERKAEAANAEKQKEEAAAAEAEKRNSVMAELLTEQQFLDLKIKAAGERLEKQGHKTRKRLKPRFASPDSARTEVSSGLEKLKALPEPEFTETSDALRVRQDSLSKWLAGLEKSLK